MNLIPLGVIWAGYALIWYGRVLTIGAGLGIADLVIPSHIPKARAWLTDKHTGSSQPVGPDGKPLFDQQRKLFGVPVGPANPTTFGSGYTAGPSGAGNLGPATP